MGNLEVVDVLTMICILRREGSLIESFLVTCRLNDLPSKAAIKSLRAQIAKFASAGAGVVASSNDSREPHVLLSIVSYASNRFSKGGRVPFRAELLNNLSSFFSNEDACAALRLEKNSMCASDFCNQVRQANQRNTFKIQCNSTGNLHVYQNQNASSQISRKARKYMITLTVLDSVLRHQMVLKRFREIFRFFFFDDF